MGLFLPLYCNVLCDDLFLYANKICWYLKEIKKKAGKTESASTMNQTGDKGRIYIHIFKFEQCAKRL